MGPFSRIRPSMTTLLVMLPRTARGPQLYPSGAGPFLTALTGGEVFIDIMAGIFLAILVLVSGRIWIRPRQTQKDQTARTAEIQGLAKAGRHQSWPSLRKTL